MSTHRSSGIRSRMSRRSAKKRMLLIVNPYATTVSSRLKNLVVYALQGRYEVEAIDTEAQNHATEIGREVRNHEYDVVVAFGGDGTLNEVANGLAGTDVPVSALPGGSTNVVCRTGIDATVVKRVDAHPKMKSVAGPYYFSWAAVSAFYRSYLVNPVRLRLRVEGKEAEGVTALAQNSDTFTYFSDNPIRVCEGVAIDDGTLAVGVLKRAATRDMPTLIARLFSERKPAARHRQIEHFPGVTEATLTSISETKDGILRPFPVQVDGDYIGEKTELKLAVDPGALTVVA